MTTLGQSGKANRDTTVSLISKFFGRQANLASSGKEEGMELYNDLCRAFPAILKVSYHAANKLDASTQQHMTKHLKGVESTFRAASVKDDQEGMLKAAKALCVLGEQLAATLRAQKEEVPTH